MALLKTVKLDMKKTIDRFRCKYMQDIEDETHDTLSALFLPDIMYSFYSETTKVAPRLDVFSIIDQLEQEPISFWNQLLTDWLLVPNVCEIKMIPDIKLAESLALVL
jgi:hypothetical protein